MPASPLPRSFSCSNAFRAGSCSRNGPESPVQASRYRVDSRPSLEVGNSYASLPPRQRAQRRHSLTKLQPTYASLPPQQILRVNQREDDLLERSARRSSVTLGAFGHKREGSKGSNANVFGYSTTTGPSYMQQHSRGGSDGTTTTKSADASSVFSRHNRSGSDDSQGSARTSNTSLSSGRHQLRHKQTFTGLNTAHPEPAQSSASSSERTSALKNRDSTAGLVERRRRPSISTMMSRAMKSMFGKQEDEEGDADQRDSAASFASMLHAAAENNQQEATVVPKSDGKVAAPGMSLSMRAPRTLDHQPSLLDFRFHFERSNTSGTLPSPNQKTQYRSSGFSVQRTPEHAYGRNPAQPHHASNSSIPGPDDVQGISFPSSTGTVLRHALATEESNISFAILNQTELERSNVTLRSPVQRSRTSSVTIQTVLHHLTANREESGWQTIYSDEEEGEEYEEVEEPSADAADSELKHEKAVNDIH
ncbi:hypothetical protein Tdes44962_MAKER01934 [Teratosphaeria destructans]|uniref:Uncharacterized protein n=1 Tax=Teratosphaeria destructans TaxID=418781 RepID=A0A9W7SW47_9PEZI|nr:hypothetical protein Tdes44962_MAKER01934 [Teratosphaeria destructans]